MCDVLTSAMAGGRFGRPVHHGDESEGVNPMQQAPHYYGGQAVIEGVMMRGATTWAVAVRRPDEDIWLERHPVGDVAHRHPIVRKPLLRGVYALVDSIGIGLKALTIAAQQASVEDDGEPAPVATGASMVLAIVLFIALFILLPSTAVSSVDRLLLGSVLGDGAAFHLVESLVRIVVFLTYIWLISRIAEIHRVFEYHGAEHKTINAWEHGDALSPGHVDEHDKAHVRCGTNFLILVMLLAMLVYTLAGAVIAPPKTGGIPAAVAYHVLLRVILLPMVAGLAYETLRLGAEKNDWAWVRALMAPGLWLQKLTTQQPDHGQLEVAIRAFEAVVPEEALGDRVDQDALTSTVVGPVVEDPELDEVEDPGDEVDPGELIA